MPNIPNRKHSKDELSDLRARSAMQTANSPIAAVYNKKLANKVVVVIGYALPIIAPAWLLVKELTVGEGYSLSDFYIMVIPIIIALILALWIAITRVLSRHNAAFILIISLFCCFPIVRAVNSDAYLKYDLMSLIGIEPTVSDPLLDSDEDGNERNTSNTMTEAERETLRRAEEKLRKDRLEWELRNSK